MYYYQIDAHTRLLKIGKLLGVLHYFRLDMDTCALNDYFRSMHRHETESPHVANTPKDHLYTVGGHLGSDVLGYTVNARRK